MSKVSVDRELPEKRAESECDWCAGAGHDFYSDKCIYCKSEPAEAEGVGLRAMSAGEWAERAPSRNVVLEDEAIAALSAVTAERDRLLDEVTELDALRDRLSGLLSQAAIALRGPEPELTRYGYADIPLRVKTVIDERDQLRAEVERLLGAMRQIRYASNNGPVSENNAGCIRRIEQIADAAMSAKEA